jgi:hypothetical protein
MKSRREFIDPALLGVLVVIAAVSIATAALLLF